MESASLVRVTTAVLRFLLDDEVEDERDDELEELDEEDEDDGGGESPGSIGG
jgi:hypothetical protein